MADRLIPFTPPAHLPLPVDPFCCYRYQSAWSICTAA